MIKLTKVNMVQAKSTMNDRVRSLLTSKQKSTTFLNMVPHSHHTQSLINCFLFRRYHYAISLKNDSKLF